MWTLAGTRLVFIVTMLSWYAGCVNGSMMVPEPVGHDISANIYDFLPRESSVSAFSFEVPPTLNATTVFAMELKYEDDAVFEILLLDYAGQRANHLGAWLGPGGIYSITTMGQNVRPEDNGLGDLSWITNVNLTGGNEYAIILAGHGVLSARWSLPFVDTPRNVTHMQADAFREWSDSTLADDPGEFAALRGPAKFTHEETFSVESVGGAFFAFAQDKVNPRVELRSNSVSWSPPQRYVGGVTDTRGGMAGVVLNPGQWDVFIDVTRSRGVFISWSWAVPGLKSFPFVAEEIGSEASPRLAS